LTPDGIYRSPTIPGFWLRESWLWNLPPVMDALLEIGGLPFAQSLLDEMRNRGVVP
jgi:hypothetical protein